MKQMKRTDIAECKPKNTNAGKTMSHRLLIMHTWTYNAVNNKIKYPQCLQCYRNRTKHICEQKRIQDKPGQCSQNHQSFDKAAKQHI